MQKNTPYESTQILTVLKCNLYTTFGITLQFSLLTLILLTLILKNHFDSPKREWWIWSLDISKQGISAFSIHLVNLILSSIMGFSMADPCKWYFLNLFLDSTIGTFFSCFLINHLKNEFQYSFPGFFQIGFYGVDFKLNWIKQTVFWVFVVGISKFITFFVLFYFQGVMEAFVEFVFGFIKGENEELLFVMVLSPLFFNLFSIVFADAYLKGSYGFDKTKSFVYTVLDNSIN